MPAKPRNPSVDFGPRLQYLYDEVSETRASIARAAGVNESTLYRIEKGIVEPSLDTLQRLSVALGVGIEELLHD